MQFNYQHKEAVVHLFNNLFISLKFSSKFAICLLQTIFLDVLIFERTVSTETPALSGQTLSAGRGGWR